MKIKNSFQTSMDVWVIREKVTTLATGEEKEVSLEADERIELKPTPTP